jgi:hypothetical protein
MHISCTNKVGSANLKNVGVSPSSQITMHGPRNWLGWAGQLTQYFNWTDGCIAQPNASSGNTIITLRSAYRCGFADEFLELLTIGTKTQTSGSCVTLIQILTKPHSASR